MEKLQGEPFDLVLLDLEMPEMDGYEVLEHLKANSPLRDIPMIMLSAAEEPESIVKCIELGAQDYYPALQPGTAACQAHRLLGTQATPRPGSRLFAPSGASHGSSGRIKANTFQSESLDEVDFQRLLGKADELCNRARQKEEDGMQENPAKKLDNEA